MGKYIPTNIDRVIQGTTFFTDRKEYTFVKLDRKEYVRLLSTLSRYTDQYVEVIYDADELTLLILSSTWSELSKQFTSIGPSISLGIITCHVSEPTVIGYLLELLNVVSPSDISVFVQGAYTTDHIFVEYPNLEKALVILNALKERKSV